MLAEQAPGSANGYARVMWMRGAVKRRKDEAGPRWRVLISYGEYRFPWYMRRLAERPANVWFVLRNIGT